MRYMTTCPSPLGEITLTGSGERLTGLWLPGQRGISAWDAIRLSDPEELPLFRRTRDWLERYFAGKEPAPGELPLEAAGSPFRQAVWAILLEIPYGQTTTYGAIARRLAAERGRGAMSAQAVGGAVGHNPIAIVIPCHRVVGGAGLVGYGGGLDYKRRLLRHEGAEFVDKV